MRWIGGALVVIAGCGQLQASEAPDSGATSTATADAGDSPDAAHFCDLQGPVLFCDDFDEGKQVDDGWQKLATEGLPGTGTVDSTFARSLPSSALLTVPKNSPTGTRAELRYVLATLPTHLRFAFDIQVGPPSGTPGDAEAVMYVFAGGCPIDLSLGPSGKFYEGPDGTSNQGKTIDEAATIKFGSWGRVELSIDFRSRTFQVSIDGHVSVPTTAFFADCPLAAPVSINVGPHYIYPSQPDDVVAHVDNVVIDTPP